MTWPEALQAAIDEFADVFDPMERYEMLFEWAAEVNELPEAEWNDANMIHGCQSQAHVMCHLDDGRFYMRGGADAQIRQKNILPRSQVDAGVLGTGTISSLHAPDPRPCQHSRL